VSVWGLESNFGKFTGVRPTIAALATLAYDQRRPSFFRAELLDALRVLDRGDIELASMKGSWAGAMGQPQLMPSSYLKFAEDFDGDGRRDIWRSSPDVFASIANYLKAHGWSPTETWGREVVLSKRAAASIEKEEIALRSSGCDAVRQMTVPRPLVQWQALGVRLPAGKPLPASSMEASLVRARSRSFLVYRNYEVILAYNCAHAYALSVGLLADRIR
jgi:membrane-bound lytic murein transglycosylase B